jgi:hypothetical protein
MRSLEKRLKNPAWRPLLLLLCLSWALALATWAFLG